MTVLPARAHTLVGGKVVGRYLHLLSGIIVAQ